ncbi:hypothetical protein PG326_03930 [Riemerella anatipestifer]|nr:hypothetical protein [Riemerella anatipestifer]MDY3357475.1 hypothetical protein [Riemerella anatipestifer]
MSVTVKGYFLAKMKILGITIPDESLDVFILSNEMDGEALVSPDDSKNLDKNILEIILALLIKPDVSEDDYSIKYDRSAIMNWYAMECKRLGVPNLLESGKNEVRDMSFLA